jgi:hypothetical protein
MSSATTVKGLLLEPARAPVRTDHTAVIVALIEQPGARPVLVQHTVGSTDAARHAAAATARQMGKGCAVSAHGTHMVPRMHRGTPVLELINARLLLDKPVNHTETTTEAAP